MPTTPNGYPYPTPDDPVSLGANDIKALAEANDARQVWFGPPDGTIIHHGVVATDAYLAVRSDAAASVYFGTLDDTRLYRSAAGVLATPGELQAVSALSSGMGTANRITLDPSGAIYIGASFDTSLYRNGASQLRTDGILMASQVWALGGAVVSNYGAPGQVSLTTPGGQPGVRLGTDTDLYRYQAGGIVVDGFFRVGGSGAGAEQSGLELFIDGAWRRVSRRSDGVMIC